MLNRAARGATPVHGCCSVPGENVHVMENGNIRLIDNLDKTFTYINSLFLPQTYISERIYMGNGGMRHPITKQLASFSNGVLTRSAW